VLSAIWRGPIPATNYMAGRGGFAVQGIIIHTMVTTLAGADATFHDPARIASAHYGVSWDGGTLYQWVQEADTAYHCGRFSPDATHPLSNETTIGIEHDDQGQPNSVRPDALYASSAALVKDVCQRHAIPIDEAHIQPHRNVSINPTACPDALDWRRIIQEAQSMSQADLVRIWYWIAFGRDPDAAELQNWLSNMTPTNGPQLFAQLMATSQAIAYRQALPGEPGTLHHHVTGDPVV
jgi:N-acetyl-anhydromuramyl-L-alanine amidase AmpD